MVRCPGFRVLAAIIAVAAGLAMPGTALAHGFAHARASHAHDEHQHAAPVAETHAGGESDSLALESGEDHGHPRVEVAPTARLDIWTPADVTVVPVTFGEITQHTSPVLAEARLPGPAPPGAPPPRLRAPPLS